ncbi:MAG: lipopolysaccharide kinase [Gammaproteobacteria bacterium]|jgi:heptose I phosphotransferase|nr:lipopolysaccharide kinase [Gammaproteobacteria bacterium]
MVIKSRFKFLLNLPGQIYRQQPGRLTKAIELDEQACFVKLHFGIGFKEIFKNLFQGRLPILGAGTENAALKKLAEIGVPSLEVVEFGGYGLNPATQHSYLVTKALTQTISLETLCASWQKTSPSIKFKRQLIREVAKIAATIHANGLNHRDFYLCHFLFDEACYEATRQIKLYLIDLHRAQIRPKTPLRWRLKDIAGLFFSALDLPLSRRDLFCFMQEYALSSQQFPVFNVEEKKIKFWHDVENKAWRLYEKSFFKKTKKGALFAIFDPSLEGETLQDFLQNPDQCVDQGQILKDDATTSVAKVTWKSTTINILAVIKRYHVRDIQKGIKRLFKLSRARRCWLQALRLRFLGIATPRPIAMLERLRSGILRESFFVTQYLAGQDLFSFLRKHPEAAEAVALQMQAIFKTLQNIYTAHGDFKATNLWVVEGKIYLLDLDGTRQYNNDKQLQQALAKDKQRFLKNWINDPALYEIFAKI